jgi:site-specific recombinase XerD
VQKIFDNACKKAGIAKEVTVHSLSIYLQPICLKGVDLRYIQMADHKHSKTTEIYTHVSTKNLSWIRSPLDMFEGEKHPE